MGSDTARARAQALDATDALAPFRQRFTIDPDGPLYCNGNSMGRLPKATERRVQQVVTEEWGRDLAGSWDRWAGLPQRVGDVMGMALLGARPGEVVLADSTSVNFYRLAAAALAAQPPGCVVMTDRANFPTDRYVLEGLCRERGATLRFVDADPVDGPDAAVVERAVAEGGEIGLVTFSHVNYRSGALADVAAVTQVAHDAGAFALWDLSHSVGSVPVDLTGCEVDLAVGCTYKYVNAGPGAPAFLYVRDDLQEQLSPPVWGWFGQRDQFAMGPAYDPAPGIARYLAGTPNVVGAVAVEEGVGLLAEAGIDRLRAKSEALTALAVDLFDAWLAPLGCTLGTPRPPERRGGHVSVCHPEAERVCAALLERGVVTDFRRPDAIRFGLPAAYTRFVDVWDALDTMRRTLE